jgi:hypothetical protein
MDSQDPIIKSMQDKRSEPPKGDVGPTPKPPIGTPDEPKKGLGEPPTPDETKIAYKAPESPKPFASSTPPPPPPKDVLELPKPMKPLHEERVKLPRGGDGTPKVNLVLIVVTILLLLLGMFVIYNKIGGFEKDSGENETSMKESVEDMNAKLDLTIQKIQEEEIKSSQSKQDLFDAGASLQKCADELVMEGEKLIADGDALKKEGEATGDQAKIDRGQNQMDRGNAMLNHGKTYDAEGKNYQSISGIQGNK